MRGDLRFGHARQGRGSARTAGPLRSPKAPAPRSHFEVGSHAMRDASRNSSPSLSAPPEGVSAPFRAERACGDVLARTNLEGCKRLGVSSNAFYAKFSETRTQPPASFSYRAISKSAPFSASSMVSVEAFSVCKPEIFRCLDIYRSWEICKDHNPAAKVAAQTTRRKNLLHSIVYRSDRPENTLVEN